MLRWSFYFLGADAVQVALTSAVPISATQQDGLESASASTEIILSSTGSSSGPQVQNTPQRESVRHPEEKEVRLVMDQAKCSREEAIAALKASGNDIADAVSFFPISFSDKYVFDEDDSDHKMDTSQVPDKFQTVKNSSGFSSEPMARHRTLSNSTSRSFLSYITDSITPSMSEMQIDGFWTSSSSSQKPDSGEKKKLPKSKRGPAVRSNFSWTSSSASIGPSTISSSTTGSYQQASEHSVDSSEAPAMPKPIKRGMSIIDAVSSYVTGDGVLEAERNAFLQAAEEGNVTMVQHLLTHPDFNVNQADRKERMTPVYLASSKNHVDVLQLLLAHPQVDINKATRKGMTPLYIACEEGHLDVVSLLFGLKDFVEIDVNRPSGESSFFPFAAKSSETDGMTPLYRACDKEHVEIVELLLTHPRVNVNQEETSGRAPLNVAVSKRSDEGKEIMRKLLVHPTTDVNQIDYGTGWTPLLEACYKDFQDRVGMLLDHANIDVNKMSLGHKGGPTSKQNEWDKWDDYSQSPLSVACFHKHEGVVNMLLSQPKINVNQMSKFGYGRSKESKVFRASALHRACEAGHSDIVRILLSTGKVNINQRTTGHESTTALFFACKRGHADIVQLILDHPDVDVNLPSQNYVLETVGSPMHIASENRHLDILQKLLAHPKIDINEALFCASTHGFAKYVEQYLANDKIDPNVRGNSGWRPLHMACKNNHTEIVRKLLAHRSIKVNGGSNYAGEHDNQYKKSALHFANNIQIIRLLLEHPKIDVNRVQRLFYPSPSEVDTRPESPPTETRLYQINTLNLRIMVCRYQAAIYNKPDVVELLLSHEKTQIHYGGYNILNEAAEKGLAQVVKVLIAHQQIKQTHVNTALYKVSHRCISKRYLTAGVSYHYNSKHLREERRAEVVNVLLSHPDIDVNFIDTHTALQLASRDGFGLVVKILLSHPNIDINKTSALNSQTALWFACFEGHVGIVRQLLARPEIDVEKKAGWFRISPLAAAKQKAANSESHVEIVKLIDNHINSSS